MILKVLRIKLETTSIFSLILEKPKGMAFYPGQYLDVELPVIDKFGKTRAFSISSSPTEEILMITFKKGLTPFKKRLEKLHAGDTIQTSHPAGTFTLDESQSAVFITGGIGITPFRSIIKWVLDKKLSTSITLIYLNSDANFAFKKELDIWQQKLPNLQITYHQTGSKGRLNATQLVTIVEPYVNSTSPIYYLAGAHSFVNSMEKIVLQMGVDQTNIRYDRFDGYA